MSYIHGDHLGSYDLITNDAGTVVQRSLFDPWGGQRLYEGTLRFDRGFTGHEAMDDFSLINMNGRMYDPILGRFLSPDNYIQLPDFTQSYNRYAYCLNNPLKFTDPSGEKLRWWHLGVLEFLTGGAISIAATSMIFHGTVTSFIDATVQASFNNIFGKEQRAGNTWKIWGGLFKTDENLSFEDQLLSLTSRFTWESYQTQLGYQYSQIRNDVGRVDRVEYFGGVTFAIDENVDKYNLYKGVSIGNYINAKIPYELNDDYPGGWIYSYYGLFWHEYGHTKDSQRFGPLYLNVIGVPSALGSQWTETRANNLAWIYAYRYNYMNRWLYPYDYPLD